MTDEAARARPEPEIGIETLIAECLQRLDASGDRGFEELCADHPAHAQELRHRIARLRERGLLRRPALERVGPYRVLRSLGRGGMGEVFLAEQTEPVRRLVALKIIRDDVADSSATARFDAERQALALMDHPGIARVFEAGSTTDGRPYFVMEYVDGSPITEWCDRNRLTLRARLALFAEVCDAAHHAHQNGFIHRDIKPSNVLVREIDGRPQPKVIDFGLAKALGNGLPLQPMQTQAGQILGTPAYMSPEQAAGDGHPVDARADVYALGALLYEITCGARPFDERRLQQAGILEMLRVIREEEPPTPTRRLGMLAEADAVDIAARRRLPSQSSLIRLLHGEIDWIVGRATSKVPSDRYASVSELAADIRRHLAGEAVLAGPPTARYRIRKFVRRHRTAVVTLAVVSIAAAAALVVIVQLGIEARENLRHFDRLAGRAQVAELLREADEDLWPAHPATVPAMRNWLARASAQNQANRRAEIEEEIARLRSRGGALEPNEMVLLDGLVALSGSLDELAGQHGVIDEVSRRIESATSIERETVEEHRAEWNAVIEDVRHTLGLELQPIVGLIPIGKDPDTNLHEFVVSTPRGRTPLRDARGHVRLTDPEDDPVMVLLAGGDDVVVGSQSTSRDSPNFDPDHGADETPAQRCRLAPFLISKFEITQAQWRRVMGSNRSTFAPGEQAGAAAGVRSELHPVESVSWIECVKFCKRTGLELPSEPQWEFAARGATDTPFWSGPSPRSLEGAANISDLSRSRRFSLSDEKKFEPWLDDSFAVHAPVGSFRANGFGLFDVTGNVWEWSRAASTAWPPEKADESKAQSYCGGSFASTASAARITYVQAEYAKNRKHVLGLRPSLVPMR